MPRAAVSSLTWETLEGPARWPDRICLLKRLMLHEGSSFQRMLIAHCSDQVCSTIDLPGINGLI